jgi:hypothetical protein
LGADQTVLFEHCDADVHVQSTTPEGGPTAGPTKETNFN